MTDVQHSSNWCSIILSIKDGWICGNAAVLYNTSLMEDSTPGSLLINQSRYRDAQSSYNIPRLYLFPSLLYFLTHQAFRPPRSNNRDLSGTWANEEALFQRAKHKHSSSYFVSAVGTRFFCFIKLVVPKACSSGVLGLTWSVSCDDRD